MGAPGTKKGWEATQTWRASGKATTWPGQGRRLITSVATIPYRSFTCWGVNGNARRRESAVRCASVNPPGAAGMAPDPRSGTGRRNPESGRVANLRGADARRSGGNRRIRAGLRGLPGSDPLRERRPRRILRRTNVLRGPQDQRCGRVKCCRVCWTVTEGGFYEEQAGDRCTGVPDGTVSWAAEVVCRTPPS